MKKHIVVKVMEEIKEIPINITYFRPPIKALGEPDIEWVDNNGINTPYLVTYV